jgi:dTDP-3-amino-3,4,6-trideoxy-alpha-D-glucose transaminase
MRFACDSAEPELPHIVSVKMIEDSRGALGVLEGLKDIGFNFRRFYFLTDLSEASERGGHAHKNLWQCFVSLRGGVTVKLEGFEKRYEFRLDRCDKALIVPPGHWRDLRDFNSDSLVVVLASENYDEMDYIRDYSEFLNFSRPAKVSSVPYIDLGRYVGLMRKDLREAIDRTLDSGVFIGGSLVEEFEIAFARHCDVAQVVGVANGYDALQLALQARDIGPGDEVIIPAHTFVATALAVARVGASPVLVDVEPDTCLMDVTELEGRMSSRTRAVIPVHLYGHPVDMDPLLEIARRHDLFVLEDAAQSHGALYKGRRCGALGDAAAFSFYPTKNLGALGDAGAVSSKDASLVRRVKQLGNYGASQKYDHQDLGINSRLDPIQASVLVRKLERLDSWNARRAELARRYLEGLRGTAGLRLPSVRQWAVPAWHVFSVQVSEGRRQALQTSLSRAGIGTNIHYPLPIHRQKCFADRGWDLDAFPVADRLAKSVLSLPLDALHSNNEIDYVIDHVRGFFKT